METTVLHPGDRPGLREAPPACRAGDTLVVTKLDRLARSLPTTRNGFATRPPYIIARKRPIMRQHRFQAGR